MFVRLADGPIQYGLFHVKQQVCHSQQGMCTNLWTNLGQAGTTLMVQEIPGNKKGTLQSASLENAG